MSTSGETADQVVRMTLNGVEVAARITGSGAKNLAVMLYAIIHDQQRTKGKVRLESLLRSGKELKVFTMKESDLRVFCKEAKKYGVLYCVLKDRNHTNGAAGAADIMVRAEDASKINRIVERFGLSSIDSVQVRNEGQSANPTRKPGRKKNRSAPSFGSRKPTDISSDEPGSDRPSVRRTLQEIRQAQRQASPARERREHEAR